MLITLDKKTGGGCSLYVDENIPYKTRLDLKLAESVFIEVNKDVFNKTRNIILGSIYRSPDSSINLFNEQLEQLLIKIDNEKKILFLSGDLNINTDSLLSKQPISVQNFVNIMSTFHYHKLIDQPTRIVKEGHIIKSSTLIDNIYTNSTDYDSGLNGLLHTDEVIGVDHKAIFTIRPNTNQHKSPKYRTQRDFSIKNVAKLKKHSNQRNGMNYIIMLMLEMHVLIL